MTASSSSIEPDCAQPAVWARNLRKSYAGKQALGGIDLTLPCGQFFGLLGPNGSGKTTTISILASLVRPSAGQARIAGFDVESDPVKVRGAIGVVFQEAAVDRSLTARQYLAFAGGLYGMPAALARQRSEQLLDLFEIAAYADKPIAALSGGMRRVIDIARGVLHQPRVLFLDEPTLGLDLLNRWRLYDYLSRLRQQRRELTILLTTHYLEEARACEQVAFLHDGKMIGGGSPDDLIVDLGPQVVEFELARDDSDREQHSAQTLQQLESLGRVIRVADRWLLLGWQGALDALPIALLGRHLRTQIRPTNLDDVFLSFNQRGSGRGESA